jgi:hypothetical protein
VKKVLTAMHDTSLYQGRNTYMYQKTIKINIQPKTKAALNKCKQNKNS